MDATTAPATEPHIYQAILEAAQSLFDQKPDWVSFFRATLGPRGIARKYFSTRETMAEFERSPVYAEIQQMLTHLRRYGVKPPTEEHTEVITIRLPKSVRDALKEEAHEYRTSMNKLCISKLLQYIDLRLVPSDLDRPSGASEQTGESEPVAEEEDEVTYSGNAANPFDQVESPLEPAAQHDPTPDAA